MSGIPDSTAKICLIFDSKSKHFLGSGIWFHLHGLIGEWLCSDLVKQSRTNGKIYPFKSTHVNLWVKGVFNRLFSSLSTLKIVYGDRFQSLAFAETLNAEVCAFTALNGPKHSPTHMMRSIPDFPWIWHPFFKGMEWKNKRSCCRDPGLFRAHANPPDLNQGPSDLQSDALPTELSRQLIDEFELILVANHSCEVRSLSVLVDIKVAPWVLSGSIHPTFDWA